MSDWKTELKRRACCGLGVVTTSGASTFVLEFLRGAMSNWLDLNHNELHVYFMLAGMFIVSYTSFHLFWDAYLRGTAWGLNLIRYGWPLTLFVFFTSPSDHVGPVFFTVTALVVLGLWRVSYLCLCRVLAGHNERKN